MIILVKVNQTYRPGMNPKIAAYSSWGCTRLLDDSSFRNQYKYLVAYYYGDIVGTFCIHGISLDTSSTAERRKVKFLLKATDDDCDNNLKNIVNNLIASRNQRIIRAISFCYIDEMFLKHNNIYAEQIDCECMLGQISILDSEKIEEPEQIINEAVPSLNLPKNVWLKISSLRSSFDSFRTPHSIETKTVIIYNPNGKIDFKKTDNSSGAVLVIKAKVDKIEINTIRFILSTFHYDPKKAIDQINISGSTKHVAHYNGFEIEFEAFSDKNMTNRIQHSKWSGNILTADNGFLKIIYNLMS